MATSVLATYQGKPITDLDEVFEICDSKKVKVEGIECTVRIRRSRFETKIECLPTPAGRKTEAYLKKKREYRDDWSFDLSQGESFFDEVAPQIRGLKLL